MLIAGRLQIRLRTLLAFVGLVCLVASFVASARREMKREDAAVEIVRAHGGDVVYEGDEGDWTRFASAASRVWPLRLLAIEHPAGRPGSVILRSRPTEGAYRAAFWQALEQLTSLHTLCLPEGDWFPADGYARIPHLPNLDRLTLPKGTTFENLDAMRTQASVREVLISNGVVTRRLMENLTSRFPGVRRLELNRSSLDQDALRGLDGLIQGVHVVLVVDEHARVSEICIEEGNQVAELTIQGEKVRKIEIARLRLLGNVHIHCGDTLEGATFLDLPTLGEIAVDSRSLRLSNLPKLHHLIVRHCSDLGLKGAPEVEFVSFARCELPAEQLTWMAECGKLRHLALDQYERLTPDVLRAVAKCSALERLSLDACDVLRADHLAELGSLTKLSDLSLQNTRFSVQDLQRLLARLRLKRLTISEYLVDRADGEQLRAAHPQVAIFLAQ